MPLYCKISHDPDKVIARGVGRVTRADIGQYLATTIEEGAKGYAKLILLGDSTLALSPDDLDAVADALVAYGEGERPGPVAIVAGNALNLDMVVLLKQRVGARPFSIFIDALKAARWLDELARPRVDRIVPAGWTSPDQPGSTRGVASSWERTVGPASLSPAPSAARS
jgi:hypothetical protein